ncbi:MAG: MerR family transcriptional regulator [Bryobacteraceae bacterium]|nr:MerR family transcriptional regulator [Bryobacteraceae bacterium]
MLGKATTASKRAKGEELFSSTDVCRLAGVTPRQLQYWGQQGLLSPVRRANRRRYAADEALAVLIVGSLRRKRFTLAAIRRALRLFRREAAALGPDFPGRTEWFLITDGKSARLENSREAIVNRFKESRRAMALVAVGELAAEVRRFGEGQAAVTPDPAPKPEAASRSSRRRKPC